MGGRVAFLAATTLAVVACCQDDGAGVRQQEDRSRELIGPAIERGPATVRVLGPDGRPVARGTVAVIGGTPPLRTIAFTDGLIQPDKLMHEGALWIHLIDAYSAEGNPLDVGRRRWGPLSLKQQQVQLTLERGRSLRGQVVDDQGRAIPGAVVELYHPDGRGWPLLARTGAAGAFLLTRLDKIVYFAHVYGPGLAPFVPVEVDLETIQELRLSVHHSRSCILSLRKVPAGSTWAVKIVPRVSDLPFPDLVETTGTRSAVWSGVPVRIARLSPVLTYDIEASSNGLVLQWLAVRVNGDFILDAEQAKSK